jgi:hypothetical protein
MVKDLKKIYPEEKLVLDIAKSIPGVSVRFSTSEEDCGYQKADLVLSYSGKDYYIQVSRHEKSKKQREKLSNRGVYSVHTSSFDNLVESERVEKYLYSILN